MLNEIFLYQESTLTLRAFPVRHCVTHLRCIGSVLLENKCSYDSHHPIVLWYYLEGVKRCFKTSCHRGALVGVGNRGLRVDGDISPKHLHAG
jgi:hypothetical protein